MCSSGGPRARARVRFVQLIAFAFGLTHIFDLSSEFYQTSLLAIVGTAHGNSTLAASPPPRSVHGRVCVCVYMEPFSLCCVQTLRSGKCPELMCF